MKTWGHWSAVQDALELCVHIEVSHNPGIPPLEEPIEGGQP